MNDKPFIIELPSLEDFPEFDPNDPFDVTAEKFRVLLIDTFLDGGDVISPDELNGAILGMLIGITSIACSCCKPEGHQIISKAMIAYIPHAIDIVRDMQGLPPLPKDH